MISARIEKVKGVALVAFAKREVLLSGRVCVSPKLESAT